MSFREAGQKYADTQDQLFQPSTIETIDRAMYTWLTQDLNLFAETKDGFEEVPVIWVGADRAYQFKKSKELRDDKSALIFPIITVERTEVKKDLARKGSAWGNIPPDLIEGGSIIVSRKINQKKTSIFANATSLRKSGVINFPSKNDKVVYETIKIPMPVYITVNYKISIYTEYLDQANELLTPFITKPGGIDLIRIDGKEGHIYEGFVDSSFNLENNISKLGDEEKRYISTINIKVLGYLIGEGKNQERPHFVKRENAVEVNFGRERMWIGDESESKGGTVSDFFANGGTSGVPVGNGMAPFYNVVYQIKSYSTLAALQADPLQNGEEFRKTVIGGVTTYYYYLNGTWTLISLTGGTGYTSLTAIKAISSPSTGQSAVLVNSSDASTPVAVYQYDGSKWVLEGNIDFTLCAGGEFTIGASGDIRPRSGGSATITNGVGLVVTTAGVNFYGARESTADDFLAVGTHTSYKISETPFLGEYFAAGDLPSGTTGDVALVINETDGSLTSVYVYDSEFSNDELYAKWQVINYADTTARDADADTPVTGDLCTVGGKTNDIYRYNATLSVWEEIVVPAVKTTSRATTTLPQGTTAALFTVTGTIRILGITGIVTTGLGSGANATKIQLNPTTGATGDLCATTDIDGHTAGYIYEVTGETTDALVANDGSAESTTKPVTFGPGDIELVCAGSISGSVSWVLTWTAISSDAAVAAA